MKLSKWGKVFAPVAVAGVIALEALAAPPPLRGYGADPEQTSVSGLSAGGFMAVQLLVAYSASFVGAGVIAGGPYYCAADNFEFTGICRGQDPLAPPNPTLMADAAKGFAREHLIDPLGNLSKRRIYLFSGTNDTVVRQSAVDAATPFFKVVGVPEGNLLYVKDLPAGHAIITPRYGNACSANTSPYISHCSVRGSGYDQAGALLGQIYGALHPRVEEPSGRIVSFDQRPFAEDVSGMADAGFIYVPPGCDTAGAHCKVHVALHGCLQGEEYVGDKFYTKAGYNNWADSNSMIVLYPQVKSSPMNPYGCWDWWGYSGADYAWKSAPQMKAINAMVKRLTRSRAKSPDEVKEAIPQKTGSEESGKGNGAE